MSAASPRLRVWYPFPLALSVVAWIVFWALLAIAIAHGSLRPRHGPVDAFAILYIAFVVIVVVGMGPAGVLKYSAGLVVEGTRFSWKSSFLSRSLVFERNEITVRVIRRERGQTRTIRLELQRARSIQINDYAWNFRALLRHLGIP